jgi:hypothetical protein
MIARPKRLSVTACFAACLLIAASVHAQPRVRLTQRDVTTVSGPAKSAAQLAQGTSTTTPRATTATPAAPQSAPIVPVPSYTDTTGSGTLPALPTLTAPSVNFDPYTCPPECPPSYGPPCPPTLAAPTSPYATPGYNQTPTYRVRLYGDVMFLQPSGGAVTNYALPVSGAVIPLPDSPVPLGPVSELNPAYTPGFRAGLGVRMTPMGEWAGMVTYLKADTNNSVEAMPGGGVLESLVFHPGTPAAHAGFLDASANSSLTMMLGDIEYRGMVPNYTGPYQTLDFVLGARYAQLDQDFSAQFSNAVMIENMNTAITFKGAGLRLGLEGERRNQRCGFLVYGRGYASFVTGQFSSTFTQQDNFAGTVANTSWTDDRIVPILDLELGLGWRSPRERFLLSAGYMVSAWYNFVSNEEFIRSVQSGTYDNCKDTMVFDGPVARAEVRF